MLNLFRASIGGAAIPAALCCLGFASAHAADLGQRPIYKAPAVAAAVYDWTGFYVGGNAGYGWGASTNRAISFVDPLAAVGFANYFATGNNVFPNLSPSGFIGGVQLGYNWQSSNFVLGVAADFQGADIGASATGVTPVTPFNTPSTQTLSQRLEWFGTVRGRAGVAAGNWHLFGTGGLAYGNVKSSLNLSAPFGPVFFAASNSETLVGWTAGAGVEYGLANWVVGLEYLHYDLGRSNVTSFAVPPGPPYPGASLSASQKASGDIVRGTLSYKFAVR
jgi:outer membrane immunogenic protein